MRITKIHHPGKRKETGREVSRVAAYCRVSTNLEDQANSYETQKTVYTEMIGSHEGWEFAGIYADRGLSGINAKRRPQFQQMIRDCDDGKIDCIICKSISRFARNARDAIYYIRHLQGLGIRVIFEKENLDTGNSFSEMTLTILAAFAEEESRSMSENIKWTMRKKAQSGEALLPRMYGYRKVEDNYEVIPEEAETVRMIFSLYEHGASPETIIKRLSERGIPTPAGKGKWCRSTILNMIENEKYVGDCKTQKTFYKDIMDGRKHKNEGVLPSVYIENHHEPIVSREQFERCGKILQLRRFSGSASYPFGELLRCPYCGSTLRFRTCYQHKGTFVCDGSEDEAACGKFILDSHLVETALVQAYNTIELDFVQTMAGLDNTQFAKEAEKMMQIKADHPILEKVDFWWLDDLVKEIRIGKQSVTFPEEKNKRVNDRTISVLWKCGLSTTLIIPSRKDPRKRAEELMTVPESDSPLKKPQTSGS